MNKHPPFFLSFVFVFSEFNQDKQYEVNTDMMVTSNVEEISQAEEVTEQLYFPRFDRAPDIIVSEHSETVQTEVVQHPHHVNFGNYIEFEAY